MLVNDLRLPAHLIELLEEGCWNRPSNIGVLAELTGAERPEDFSFNSLDGMSRETAGMMHLWKQGYGHSYSLTSSDDSAISSNPDLLVINRSVLIVGNWDEEVICLDYRESLSEPRVVCGIWPDSQGVCRWKVIAPTFESFAEHLGL
jgi:hypothetical protein